MRQIPSNNKDDVSTLSAVDFNSMASEINNILSSSNQTFENSKTNQLATAITNYISNASYYIESAESVADAYVVEKPSAILSAMPSAYFNGMKVQFLATHGNTGESTINVGNLGVKSIKTMAGNPIGQGAIKQSGYVELIYLDNEFRILELGGSGGSGLKIGMIFPSVGVMEDSDLHYLDGTLIPQDGMYTDFAVYVKKMVAAGRWFSCTQDEFDSDIADKKQCGKFVIDDVNNTIRLPKITRFIGAALDLSDFGKAYAESLPNIEGGLTNVGDSSTTGAFYLSDRIGTKVSYAADGDRYEVLLDASRSSEAYQDNAEVQPYNVRYPYYIVVSNTGQQDPVTVDINQIAADLQLKADKTSFFDVTQYDFMANKADFAHAKYNSTSYEGLSYIDMWHMQATSVFAKDRFVLEPCSIRLVADGVTHYYHNFQAQEIIPSAILDSGTTLQAGKEYYVYVVWDSANSKCKLVCSLNSSYPQGYSATTSRKIIWFHTLCAGAGTIAGHIANGYAAADIIPNSIACLGFRPKSSPDGMVYIDVIDHWADIYLQSGTGINTASVFGGTVTDTRYYQNHVEDMMSVDKILPNDVQFTALAWGSNQKTVISEAKDWVTTGGHIDTANRRMIGQYFVEDACGFMWQFLNSTSASGGGNWTGITTDLGSGSFYGGCFVLLAGGYWSDGAHCGVGCRNGPNSRSPLRVNNSCRGLSQNIRMNLLGK